MKKIIFAFAFVCLSATAFGQIASPNALGVRLGWGAEISYQRQTIANQRIEADLGIFKKGMNIAGVYQWVVNMSGLSEGFNFYAGPGVNLGFWSQGAAFGFCAQVGLEYNIPRSPVQLSLDYRPTLYISPGVEGDAAALGLGVRFLF